jgi:outer membrane protein W
MKKFIKIVTPLLFIVFTSYAQVQLKGLVSFNYSYGTPMSDVRNYIPKKAFHGASVDTRRFITDNVALGVHIGWNSFKTVMPRAVYETDKGTVSAVQSRFFYSFPILVTGYYYFRKSDYIRPYVGGGIGIYDVNYRKWFGTVSSDHKDAFYFGICPEVGVLLPFGNTGIGLMISEKFNNVFYSYKEVKNVRYFETSVGIYIGK